MQKYFNFEIKNYKKKLFFLFFYPIFTFFNIFKNPTLKVFYIIKGMFPKILRPLAQKIREEIDF